MNGKPKSVEELKALLKRYQDERDALKVEIAALNRDLQNNEDQIYDLKQQLKNAESETGE